jgi:hypothetical protein
VNGGRTFTTMFLMNFPPNKPVELPTLIHELTHVWQGINVGPIYEIEALEAQLSAAGYNYGFTNDSAGWTNGEGGEAALTTANGNFNAFNREQQAMIIQHYYVRRFGSNPPLEYTEWQPYANLVYAA